MPSGFGTAGPKKLSATNQVITTLIPLSKPYESRWHGARDLRRKKLAKCWRMGPTSSVARYLVHRMQARRNYNIRCAGRSNPVITHHSDGRASLRCVVSLRQEDERTDENGNTTAPLGSTPGSRVRQTGLQIVVIGNARSPSVTTLLSRPRGWRKTGHGRSVAGQPLPSFS